jgi:hypothetical protein
VWYHLDLLLDCRRFYLIKLLLEGSIWSIIKSLRTGKKKLTRWFNIETIKPKKTLNSSCTGGDKLKLAQQNLKLTFIVQENYYNSVYRLLVTLIVDATNCSQFIFFERVTLKGIIYS